jgi:hypothetical protein
VLDPRFKKAVDNSKPYNYTQRLFSTSRIILVLEVKDKGVVADLLGVVYLPPFATGLFNQPLPVALHDRSAYQDIGRSGPVVLAYDFRGNILMIVFHGPR